MKRFFCSTMLCSSVLLVAAPARADSLCDPDGGIITTLAVEQRPDLFAAGLAACGPIGSFPLQINYFGDARATFEYFFPGLIPGDPFHPDLGLTAIWSDYYTNTVEPIVFQSSNRHLLDQWVRAAKLPFDADNYLDTVRRSASDVLRYSVVNWNDPGP